MVFAEAHYDEPRHRAIRFELAIFLEEHFDVIGVAHFVALEAGRAVIGTGVPDEAGYARFHLAAAVGLADALAVFAVTSIRKSGASAGVPQITTGAFGKIAFGIVLDADALGIRQVPVAGDVV